MKTKLIVFVFTVLCLVTGNSLLAAEGETRINNIVLVHGAWVDASGWKGVYDILTGNGYHVSLVQEPEDGFANDVEATKRVLALQDGPCILVAHSYGGTVITEAGNDPKVAGLVYIAAHMPDTGETESTNSEKMPSELNESFDVKTTSDGFTYLEPSKFPYYFAPELEIDDAQFMAQSQVMNLAKSFHTTITQAAWRTKPSWMLVAGADRVINPKLEQWYAERAKSRDIVTVEGACHAVFISHPWQVAELIETAANSLNP